MRALTRRQRIQREITPSAIPESFLPLLVESAHAHQSLRAEVNGMTARMDTFECLVMPHIDMLEKAIPTMIRNGIQSLQATLNAEYERFAKARNATKRAIRRSAQAVTANLARLQEDTDRIHSAAEQLPKLRTKRERLRWLMGR